MCGIAGWINWKHNLKNRKEILRQTYIEWGEECLQYLNGIFAFAIWDQSTQKLFMARDRIGVKPCGQRSSGHGRY